MRNPLLVPELRELLQEGRQAELLEVLQDMHPSDAASILSGLEPAEVLTVLSWLPPVMERDVFGYLEPDLQEQIVLGGGRDRVKAVLASMASDDRAEFLDRLDERIRDRLVPLLSNAAREDLLRRSQFQDDQVGSFLSTDYAVLNRHLTARRAIEELRQQAPSKETIYYSYVVDRTGKLVGFVSLRDLILAPDDQTVGDLMKTDIKSVTPETDQEQAAQLIRDYDLIALPVVDEGGRLVGIVTHDDAVDIVEEEAQEDFEKMAGITGHDAVGDYDPLATSMWVQVRRRAPVICLLALFWVVTAGVIQGFEEHLKSGPTLLLALLPMVMATGGMVGTQASALVIRALSIGEAPTALLRTIWQELKVSTTMGAVLAAIAFVDALIVSRLDPGGPEIARVLHIGAVIGIALMAHVVSAALMGATIPLLVKRLRGDPAMISTPAVTAVADLTGALIYLLLVTALL